MPAFSKGPKRREVSISGGTKRLTYFRGPKGQVSGKQRSSRSTSTPMRSAAPVPGSGSATACPGCASASDPSESEARVRRVVSFLGDPLRIGVLGNPPKKSVNPTPPTGFCRLFGESFKNHVGFLVGLPQKNGMFQCVKMDPLNKIICGSL